MENLLQVFFLLVIVATSGLVLTTATTIFNLVVEKALILFDHYFHEEGAQSYTELVALPFVAAIVGALFGTAIQTVVEHPPKVGVPTSPELWAAYAEFGIGALIGVSLPLLLQRVLTRQKGLVLSARIHLLRRGKSVEGKDVLLAEITADMAKAERAQKKGSKRFVSLIIFSVIAGSVYFPLVIAWFRRFDEDYGMWRVLPYIALIIVCILVRLFIRKYTFAVRIRQLKAWQSEVENFTPKLTSTSGQGEVHQHLHYYGKSTTGGILDLLGLGVGAIAALAMSRNKQISQPGNADSQGKSDLD